MAEPSNHFEARHSSATPWGDDFYLVIGTFGADGRLTGLDIDRQVVSEFTE